MKFTLTIEGDATDLDGIVKRLAFDLNAKSATPAPVEVAVHDAILTGAGGVKVTHVPVEQVMKTVAEAGAGHDMAEPVDPDGPDVDGPPTNKREEGPRPGTAAALLNDPSQPGQEHLAEEAQEGLNEEPPAEVVDLVVDPENLTGELYDLAQTMEGRMETDGIQLADKKRAKGGDVVGFMYDASKPPVDATVVKTWRGKALIVDKDGDGHIVGGKELISATTTEAETTTDQAETATDQAEIAPADSDTVRQLYTSVAQRVSQQRAIQIMVDVAGKKKLGEFSDDELAKVAAMLRDELSGFEAAQ